MDYDRDPILSHTAYSYDEIKQLIRFSARLARRVFTVLTPVSFVRLLLLAAITRAQRRPLAGLLSCLAELALLVLVLCCTNGLFYTRRRHEKRTRLFKNGQRFAFRSYDFTVENEQSDFKGQTTMHYASLHRVVETNDMFYLYIGRRQAYLVSKEGLQNAGPDQLRALLRQALPPEKYKVTIRYRAS